MMDSHAEPSGFSIGEAGTAYVEVHLTARDLHGNALFDAKSTVGSDPAKAAKIALKSRDLVSAVIPPSSLTVWLNIAAVKFPGPLSHTCAR